MGFSDRLRAWLRGDAKRKPNRSTDPSSRGSTKDLEDFVDTRVGVEAYLEPKTAIYSTTVLLIADDGEYLRRPVKDKEHAREFAAKTNIPLYDARKVGYPKRMRDYDQGKRPRRVELSELPPWPGAGPGPSPAVDGPPPPPVRPPSEPPPAAPAPSGPPGAAAPDDAAPDDAAPDDAAPDDAAPDGVERDERRGGEDDPPPPARA